jgi:2-phospho-L-lactate/phosphoenolpyruvate guanylyltransferase
MTSRISSRTCAIVPVKALEQAKRRLAPVLPDAARQQLVVAMLKDVLAALAGVESIDWVVVVTPDHRVAGLAQGRGASVLPEPAAAELNAAIASGIAYACALGACQALVLPADVPLTTSRELASLVQSRGGRRGITLAPSHDNNGTNGLLLTPPHAIQPCYGPGSYLKHLSQAMARRVDVNVVHLDGLSRDIDEPNDLVGLLDDARVGKRYPFIAPHVAAAKVQPSPQGNGQ